MLKRYHTLSQLCGLVFGFFVTIMLLESGGLVVWAERLEVSKTQQQIVDWATRLNNQLAPLGISAWRSDLLTKLDAVGWNEANGDLSLGWDIETEQVVVRTLNLLQPLRYYSAELVQSKNPVTHLNELPPLILEAQAANPEATENSIPTRSESLLLATNIDPMKVQGAQPNNATYIENSAKQTKSIRMPLPLATAKKPRAVALVGDSMMAVGLSAQLLRETAQYEGLKMIRAFRSGTGLSRPEVFNWLSEYPQIIAQQRPDVIILSMGANDAQGFVVDKKVLAFGSPEWEIVYTERVRNFLNLLLKHDTTVLMMSLPPMRSKSFNQKIQLINGINKSVATTMIKAGANIIWWDPTRYFENESGEFQEFITKASTKKIVRIRSSDGIHLSDEGAGLITPMLINWLNPERIDQSNSLK